MKLSLDVKRRYRHDSTKLHVMTVMVQVQKMQNLNLVTTVEDKVKYSCDKDLCSLHKPVRNVKVKDKVLKRIVEVVMVKGIMIEEDTVTVTIPAGVDSGNRLRAQGYGNEGRNGQRGDLYITFHVEEDENFVRNGTDIYIEVPVFFTQAVLGETISIPALDGELELELKQSTKDKEQFVFDGEGVADVHGGRKGRLIAQVQYGTS